MLDRIVGPRSSFTVGTYCRSWGLLYLLGPYALSRYSPMDKVLLCVPITQKLFLNAHELAFLHILERLSEPVAEPLLMEVVWLLSTDGVNLAFSDAS